MVWDTETVALGLAIAKGIGGGGGGGGVKAEALSVSANGDYTAPAGKAYTPVHVDVPNSYTAGDEGKVVSGGALMSGVMLKPMFRGTGYDENQRTYGDFGSEVYIIEEM